jgi:hypothetical protein
MCQSKAEGGRRCPGRGTSTRTRRTSAQPATAPAVTATATVPSREDVDRLAAELPADRTGWDGSRLSERDRRRYALRESGWDGPIDQDGYADIASDGAGTLRRMAEQRGEAVSW